MSYLRFHEIWTITWGNCNVVWWWAIMTEQRSQSREVLLLTKWSQSFSCYLLTTELINELKLFCLVPEKMQKFTEVMESGTKWSDHFVITLGISSLFIKLTKRICPTADAHELISFSCYLLTPALMEELNVFCLFAGRIQ